ncbi:MAG: type II toxin-antitoxin system HicA family toxin [Chloroflexi bacterium]|nr:type II toxin-antitoxin system HicA family toxin [Chloroflexota bacterium]
MPTFRDLLAFVENDGWVEEANLARGRRRVGDHRRFRKEPPDETILRTKVSHAIRDEIGSALFGHILRDQLHVDEARFWAVARGRGTVEQAEAAPPSTATIPGWLVKRLLFTVGLTEEEVRTLTPEGAKARWDAFVRSPKG